MGFIPKLCRPYRPQTKGKVERMVRYVRDNFFRPLNTKIMALGQRLDLETANEQLVLWLDSVAHQRIHNTTQEKPADRLIEERKYLQALPPEVLPATSSLLANDSLATFNKLSQQPLHHDLSIYDQLVGAI